MGLNVLIVDDSDIIRRMIVRTLELADVDLGQVFEAGNGKEALGVLASSWVDLVFADINMPVMDGAQMIARMRETRETADVPVIVVTTEGAAERIAELQAVGVAAFVRKPFTPEQIRDVVIEVTSGLGAEAVELPVDAVFPLVVEHFALAFTETVVPGELPEPDGSLLEARLDFTGACSGTLSLMAPEALCVDLASYMLGVDLRAEDARERAADALGELANMTGGHLVTSVESGKATDLRPPVVSRLQRSQWDQVLETERTWTFLVDGHPMIVSARLRSAAALSPV